MASFYKEGALISFNGFKGAIVQITETYRKNVLVVKLTEVPKNHGLPRNIIETIGLFEYPDGRLEFMAIID